MWLLTVFSAAGVAAPGPLSAAARPGVDAEKYCDCCPACALILSSGVCRYGGEAWAVGNSGVLGVCCCWGAWLLGLLSEGARSRRLTVPLAHPSPSCRLIPQLGRLCATASFLGSTGHHLWIVIVTGV